MSKTVLVIDRDDGIRKLLAYVLSQSGFRVLEGAGAHAVDLCCAVGERVDLVLAEERLASKRIPLLELPKPFSIPELLADLNAALASRKLPARAFTPEGGAAPAQHPPQQQQGVK